ncbi:MAG: YihA family ribosome biogenesis GTP-binding protein [Desulfobulbaceae bacterium]|nr:YihA family ribosome biogenesis GTP-binding protein [Desulfobulbaceae bacterium]
MNFNNAVFFQSVHSIRQLPELLYPEIAFAGRSNVGKSSLINKIIGRKNLVKISSRPGKTQSLNYFVVDEKLYFVDLPGYGFARVSKQVRSSWQKLITAYLEERESLACVVVIIDLRHELKARDRDLVDWLRFHGLVYLPVYTKADKIPKNKQLKNASALDAALTVSPQERILFSSKTGQGCEALQRRLALYGEN